MKIAVVDDDKDELSRSLRYLDIISNEENKQFDVFSFSNPNDLINKINNNEKYDLYLLDIIMPFCNGIELAKLIRKTKQKCKIVFLTTSKDFALDSYGVQAFQYLVKPYSIDEFKDVIMKIESTYSLDAYETSFVVKTEDGLRRIGIMDVLFIESKLHIQNIYLKEEVISIRMSSIELDKLLDPYGCFARCHKSYLINLYNVDSIKENEVCLFNGDKIEMSKRMATSFKNRYVDFFLGKKNG